MRMLRKGMVGASIAAIFSSGWCMPAVGDGADSSAVVLERYAAQQISYEML